MADFSLTHPLSGFFSPARFEADILDCVVTGTIPKYLNGAFYRLHGDWVYAPKFRDEASLSADGYISMLRSKIDTPGVHKLIHTSRGVGYVVRDEEPV